MTQKKHTINPLQDPPHELLREVGIWVNQNGGSTVSCGDGRITWRSGVRATIAQTVEGWFLVACENAVTVCQSEQQLRYVLLMIDAEVEKREED